MSNVELSIQNSDVSFFDESFDKNLLPNYHLSLQLGLRGFSFSILDTKRNKYIGLESIQFETNLDFPAICDAFQEQLNKKELLQDEYKSVSAAIVHNKSTLIPVPLFEQSKKENYSWSYHNRISCQFRQFGHSYSGRL